MIKLSPIQKRSWLSSSLARCSKAIGLAMLVVLSMLSTTAIASYQPTHGQTDEHQEVQIAHHHHEESSRRRRNVNRRFMNAGGRCLDVHAPDIHRNGARVQIWDCNNQPQQAWQFRGNAIVLSNGKCLDAHAPDIRRNGARVQAWDCNGQPQQQWFRRRNAIVNAGGLCLDVHAPHIHRNGGRVQLWECNGQRQQRWSFR